MRNYDVGILYFFLCEVSGRPIMYVLSESDSFASSLSQYIFVCLSPLIGNLEL